MLLRLRLRDAAGPQGGMKEMDRLVTAKCARCRIKNEHCKTKDMGVKGAAENQDKCVLCLNKNKCHELNTY